MPEKGTVIQPRHFRRHRRVPVLRHLDPDGLLLENPLRPLRHLSGVGGLRVGLVEGQQTAEEAGRRLLVSPVVGHELFRDEPAVHEGLLKVLPGEKDVRQRFPLIGAAAAAGKVAEILPEAAEVVVPVLQKPRHALQGQFPQPPVQHLRTAHDHALAVDGPPEHPVQLFRKVLAGKKVLQEPQARRVPFHVVPLPLLAFILEIRQGVASQDMLRRTVVFVIPDALVCYVHQLGVLVKTDAHGQLRPRKALGDRPHFGDLENILQPEQLRPLGHAEFPFPVHHLTDKLVSHGQPR